MSLIGGIQSARAQSHQSLRSYFQGSPGRSGNMGHGLSLQATLKLIQEAMRVKLKLCVRSHEDRLFQECGTVTEES